MNKNMIKQKLLIHNKEVVFNNVSFVPTNDVNKLYEKINKYLDSSKIIRNILERLFFQEYFLDKLRNAMQGYQYDTIMKVMRENSHNCCMTGSFILSIFNKINKSNRSWTPGDIDIFTTDVNFHEKLNAAFNDKNKINNKMFKRNRGEYKFFSKKEEYIPNREVIIGIHEWENLKNDIKLQVIIIKNDINKVTDINDLDIVKSRYNGKRLYIPEVTLDCLAKNETSMINKFHTTNELNNTMLRATKYSNRGYTINYPKNIFMDTNIDYDYLNPCIMKLYHSTKDKKILILNNDEYKPNELFIKIIKKINIMLSEKSNVFPCDIYFYGFNYEFNPNVCPEKNFGKEIVQNYLIEKNNYYSLLYSRHSEKNKKKPIEIFYDTFKFSQLDLLHNKNKVNTYEKILREIADKVSFIDTDEITELRNKINELQNKVKLLEDENKTLRKIKDDIMNILTLT